MLPWRITQLVAKNTRVVMIDALCMAKSERGLDLHQGNHLVDDKGRQSLTQDGPAIRHQRNNTDFLPLYQHLSEFASYASHNGAAWPWLVPSIQISGAFITR